MPHRWRTMSEFASRRGPARIRTQFSVRVGPNRHTSICKNAFDSRCSVAARFTEPLPQSSCRNCTTSPVECKCLFEDSGNLERISPRPSWGGVRTSVLDSFLVYFAVSGEKEAVGTTQTTHLNFTLNAGNQQFALTLVTCRVVTYNLPVGLWPGWNAERPCGLEPILRVSDFQFRASDFPAPAGRLGPVKEAIFVPGRSFYGPVPYNG
jgi:hypothetical protein